MKKILIVGITPPPYGGQAMMTERLVKAKFTELQVYHVRMAFSKSMKSVGTFEVGKVLHMFSVVLRALYFRFRYGINTLYYMPGGSNFTPIARDIFILFFLRTFFSKTIFHFRAAGVSEIVRNQPYVLRKAATLIYNKPELAIQLSALNPDDGQYFKAKKVSIIPNGLEDAALPYIPIVRQSQKIVTILYVGVVQETKGIMVLLEATKMLLEAGYKIRVNIIGEFNSEKFRVTAINYCRNNNLEDTVNFLGVKKGEEKWLHFNAADIFCFPSYFESESFGNVAVEAMMFGLPIVATEWRGIPDIVKDGLSGFLVKIKSADQLKNKLSLLIEDQKLRIEMGTKGRQIYEETFQINRFMDSMERALSSV
ncbi:glycosyltransferase [Cesiribacter sp. SM1]|uniref:glycosyltransferase n=1 Tax=Cesiribacter sp. SM1 TaxID=2861196 RepID=UPI001CD49A0E|nr:glycosyltransferase [Cesiribacter sp. SM1]